LKKIALVTDSTADLTTSMKEDFSAHVIPLKISFGEQEYFDGELTSEEFYERLEAAPELPSRHPNRLPEILLYYTKNY
jgi:fatty acid-binding protein DegV